MPKFDVPYVALPARFQANKAEIMAAIDRTLESLLSYSAGSFPVAERACGRIISLPLFPEMETGQQERTISLIKKFFRS